MYCIPISIYPKINVIDQPHGNLKKISHTFRTIHSYLFVYKISHMIITYAGSWRQISLPESEKPSCLQTTVASLLSKLSSQTVPHVPLLQTSKRPSRSLVPPTSLISPCTQIPTLVKSKKRTVWYYDSKRSCNNDTKHLVCLADVTIH